MNTNQIEIIFHKPNSNARDQINVSNSKFIFKYYINIDSVSYQLDSIKY